MFDAQFRHPLFLTLALAAIPVWRIVRGRQASIDFSAVEPLTVLPATIRAQFTWLPALLYALALIALAVALARPQTSARLTHIEREGVAIMMVIDRSSSMNARDLVQDDRSINRLDVVKQVFKDFVLGTARGTAGKGRPDDLVGLVTFAGYADSICPLTLDHRNLTLLVDQLEIVNQRSEDGTALGDGLALAVERLRRSDAKSRVAILLTDGQHNAGVIDPRQAADLAQKLGVKVYCIGTGTTGIAPIPQIDPFTGKTVLVPDRVRIDEDTLQEVAKRTGGEYFRATDDNSLASIYGAIDQLERTKIAETRYLRYEEWFAPFAAGALVLIGLAAILEGTIFRRIPAT